MRRFTDAGSGFFRVVAFSLGVGVGVGRLAADLVSLALSVVIALAFLPHISVFAFFVLTRAFLQCAIKHRVTRQKD